MNSLSFWATNDGTGLKISDTQRAIETSFLKSRLQALEKALDAAVRDCLLDMNEALAENIFENFGEVVQQAAAQALPTAQKWGSPVNRVSFIILLVTRSSRGYRKIARLVGSIGRLIKVMIAYVATSELGR
jgi:hypothetical protein